MKLGPRIRYRSVAPEVYQAMQQMETAIRGSGLEPSLLELVKIRVSQINGCAYCIDMHTKDARAAGESEQKIYLLDAWRETPFYTDRERAGLAWAESLTTAAATHVPDEVFDEARQEFSEKELADLTLAVITITGWNQLGIAFRSVPGAYQPRAGGKTEGRKTKTNPAGA